MALKADSDKLKLIQDKCQVILGNLLREEDNKYCVDCDAKGPRWASWNLGIFLCIRCAGIHRNLGVHISKVKSVNLDTWTPEQVACLQQMGNSKARAVYEANLPEGFRRPTQDSTLESFIRAKYEQKKYIAREWVQPPPPPPAFDIDEEKKKEKERKRNKTKNLPQHPTAVPRPHSAGPHSPAIQESSKQMQQVPDSSDLLSLEIGQGVDNSETDIFDAFLSAPTFTAADKAPTSVTSSSVSSVLKSTIVSEETDFFNQKAIFDVNTANKLTKESILSLYSSNTVQIPATQHINPVYGVPSSMYIGQQGYGQIGMTGYPSIPIQGMNTSSMRINAPANINPFTPINTSPFTANAGIRSNMPVGVTPCGWDQSLLMTHGIHQADSNIAANNNPLSPVSTSQFTNKADMSNMSIDITPDKSNDSLPMSIGTPQAGTNMPANYNPFSVGTPAIRQDARNHPNMWIGVTPGGRDDSLLMAHGVGQVSHQMANLQLSGQAWNMSVPAAPVNAPGMVISSTQAAPGAVWPPNIQNQNQNNLWH